MPETVVVLSTADFNAAVWTNKQHLATRLARHVPVKYIESIGLRQPTASFADAKRILLRLVKKPTIDLDQVAPENLRVVKPHVLPFHGVRLIRSINTWVLNRQVRKLLSAPEAKPVLWTFSPVTYGIEEHFDKVVYHSVDLLHTLPHMPTKYVLDSEKRLLQRADVIIASSTGVQSHLKNMTKKPIQLWENVADTKLLTETVSNARHPRAVFAGNLTATKVNFDLLSQLAQEGLEIVLAGPTAIDGTKAATDLTDLTNHPNVNHVGNLKPAELAQLLNSCTVGLIPYHINQYTTGVFPMKVYEYLAAGLSVVTTQLPSLSHIEDEDIHIVENTIFSSTALKVAHPGQPDINARKNRALSHSWEARTERAMSIIRKPGR